AAGWCLLQSRFPADQRELDAASLLLLSRADDQPRRHRRRLAPGFDFYFVAELEVGRRPHGAVAGEDGPWFGRLLEPRRHVGGVAGDEEVAGGLVAAGHHPPGADAATDGGCARRQ